MERRNEDGWREGEKEGGEKEIVWEGGAAGRCFFFEHNKTFNKDSYWRNPFSASAGGL